MSILQTEAGFVSFCHLGAVQTQQVVVGENLHAVVMSGGDKTTHTWKCVCLHCKYVRNTHCCTLGMWVGISVSIWDCGVIGRCRVRVSPVALVPDPGLVTGPGPEIGLPVVLDLGGEAEEAAVGAGVGGVGASWQALLLQSALQHVHGSVLQVGGLFNKLGIENQIWRSWGMQTEPQRPEC